MNQGRLFFLYLFIKFLCKSHPPCTIDYCDNVQLKDFNTIQTWYLFLFRSSALPLLASHWPVMAMTPTAVGGVLYFSEWKLATRPTSLCVRLCISWYHYCQSAVAWTIKSRKPKTRDRRMIFNPCHFQPLTWSRPCNINYIMFKELLLADHKHEVAIIYHL